MSGSDWAWIGAGALGAALLGLWAWAVADSAEDADAALWKELEQDREQIRRERENGEGSWWM